MNNNLSGKFNSKNISIALLVINIAIGAFMIIKPQYTADYSVMFGIIIIVVSGIIIYLSSEINSKGNEYLEITDIWNKIADSSDGHQLDIRRIDYEPLPDVKGQLPFTAYPIGEDNLCYIWQDDLGNNNAFLAYSYLPTDGKKLLRGVLSDKIYTASVPQILKLARDAVYGSGTKGAINVLRQQLGDDAVKKMFDNNSNVIKK